jgi:hypothetical protein
MSMENCLCCKSVGTFLFIIAKPSLVARIISHFRSFDVQELIDLVAYLKHGTKIEGK